MRASKEQCEQAQHDFLDLVNMIDQPKRDYPSTKAKIAFVADFLAVAKRRLPTEAAYDRDRKRKAAKS